MRYIYEYARRNICFFSKPFICIMCIYSKFINLFNVSERSYFEAASKIEFKSKELKTLSVHIIFHEFRIFIFLYLQAVSNATSSRQWFLCKCSFEKLIHSDIVQNVLQFSASPLNMHILLEYIDVK